MRGVLTGLVSPPLPPLPDAPNVFVIEQTAFVPSVTVNCPRALHEPPQTIPYPAGEFDTIVYVPGVSAPKITVLPEPAGEPASRAPLFTKCSLKADAFALPPKTVTFTLTLELVAARTGSAYIDTQRTAAKKDPIIKNDFLKVAVFICAL